MMIDLAAYTANNRRALGPARNQLRETFETVCPGD
jgi:hypothetical protein